MDWYADLYTGANAEKKKTKIMRNVNQNKVWSNIYLITLAANPQNQLDILPAWNLKFPYLKRSCPLIVGIALGYEEAQELVSTIVADVYEHTGAVCIREYLETKAQSNRTKKQQE